MGLIMMTVMDPMRCRLRQIRNIAADLLLVVELRMEIVLDQPQDFQKLFAAIDRLVE